MLSNKVALKWRILLDWSQALYGVADKGREGGTLRSSFSSSFQEGLWAELAGRRKGKEEGDRGNRHSELRQHFSMRERERELETAWHLHERGRGRAGV